MRLFDKTLSNLPSYLKQFENKNISKGLTGHVRMYESVRNYSTAPKLPPILDFNEEDLARYFSPSPLRLSNITIGDHPDFRELGHNETTKHYAVSLFMDIKVVYGIWLRWLKISQELRRLKDNILTLAIKVCNYFGGHVQRLQEMAYLVLFTRKNYQPNDAIIGALNASSVLSYFIKYEFAPGNSALRNRKANKD